MVARQMRFTEQCAHMHMTARRSQGKVGAFTLILSLASKSAYNADSFRAPSQISFLRGNRGAWRDIRPSPPQIRLVVVIVLLRG